MQREFTEDQAQFRELVARFMQSKAGPAAARQLMESESGFDQAVWAQMGSELGLMGTHIPEAYGGFGFGQVELGIILEEMGRQIYTGPFFASAVMAGYALLLTGSEEAKQTWLPSIASGELIATLVLGSLNSPDQPGQAVQVSAGKLTGRAPLVVDAMSAASLFVIAGNQEGRLSLHHLAASSPGITITPVQSLDPTRRLAEVSFDKAAAEPLGSISDLAPLWDHLCLALACEMLGGAQQLLDSTLEYTKMRYQFGRPIGSFQSLKHRLADLLMEMEFARAATHHASFLLAHAVGEGANADLADAAGNMVDKITGLNSRQIPSMVKAMAADVYMLAAREAVQMRGGIGFTWEEDTHLWFKRAKSSEVFLGTPAYHRERMMTLLAEDTNATAVP